MNENIVKQGEDFKVDYENLGAIQAELDFLEDNKPFKTSQMYPEWLERFNYLANLYNSLTDSKIYSTK